MHIKILFLILILILITGCDTKTKKPNSGVLSDNTPPVLLLKGDKNITLEVAQKYKEFGFKATDDVDGDITNKVVVTGKVDVTKPGRYILTYSVADSAGNEVGAKRVINVVDTTPPVLTLKGESNITLNVNQSYEELGFYAVDNVDGNITKDVEVKGSVDITKPGEYTLIYSVKDSSKNEANATRVVSVEDNTPPLLMLKGNKSILLPVNKNYKEPGFSAIDNVDGNITNKVVVDGLVSTSMVGIYKLDYSVKDSSNNESNKSREIKVTTFATAKLGALADSKVDIYKFNSSGKLELLWSESTTDGESLAEIGKFNTHAYELEDNTLYLYKVSGGKDYDSNNDGIKDSNFTKNLGSISAVVTKSDVVSNEDSFNITLLSQYSYDLVKKDIKYNYNFNDIKDKLEQVSKDLVNKRYVDLLKFNPVTNLDWLNGMPKSTLNRYIDLIHNNKTIIANLTQDIANIKTADFARSITEAQDSNIFYIADGSGGISIFNKKEQKIVKSIKTKDFARKIALSDSEDFAFVADSKAGFSVVDLKKEEVVANIPTYEGNVTGDYDARYVYLEGNTAYVAASKKGIMVIDISKPTNPKLIKVVDTPDIAYKVELISDTTALVADGKTGLLAINLDTNETISKLNTYGSANSFTYVGELNDIFIADGYKGLVVAHLDELDNKLSYQYHVDTPDYATNIKVSLSLNRVYVADKKSNIQVIDIGIDKPAIIDAISTPYRSYDLVLLEDESKAVVATGSNGLEVVSLSKVDNPAILSEIKSDYRAYGITKNDNILYIAQGYKGLQVVDATNPLELKVLGTLDTDGFALNSLIYNNDLLLADGYKGLQIVDINKASEPTIVENIATNDFTADVKLVPNNDFILVSDGKDGVKLIDTINIVDTLKTSNKAGDITVTKDGKVAYVAVGDKGVDVVAIYNSTLKLIKTIDVSRYIKSITLNAKEDRAYLAGEDGLVTIYDLENSKVVADIKLGTFTNKVALSKDEKYLYVADDSMALVIVDLSSNEVIGKVELKDKVKDIVIDGDIAYVSTYNAGVVTIDLELLK